MEEPNGIFGSSINQLINYLMNKSTLVTIEGPWPLKIPNSDTGVSIEKKLHIKYCQGCSKDFHH